MLEPRPHQRPTSSPSPAAAPAASYSPPVLGRLGFMTGRRPSWSECVGLQQGAGVTGAGPSSLAAFLSSGTAINNCRAPGEKQPRRIGESHSSLSGTLCRRAPRALPSGGRPARPWFPSNPALLPQTLFRFPSLPAGLRPTRTPCPTPTPSWGEAETGGRVQPEGEAQAGGELGQVSAGTRPCKTGGGTPCQPPGD